LFSDLFTTYLCDPKWMKDNIEPKLAGMSGEAIAEMQQPRRTRAKRWR